MNCTTMGEESKYAYLLHDKGLLRVNVSEYCEDEDELKLECIFYDRSNLPFSNMALFSHRHTLYLIGGDSAETGNHPDGSSFYTFDPNTFKQFPVIDLECLDQRQPDYCKVFKPVKWPRVIRANPNRMIYFFPNLLQDFCFQSFDLVNNRFRTLPTPPFADDMRNRVSGEFFLKGYIYIFVREFFDTGFRAFSFNTGLLQWQEEESMVLEFGEEDIPLPVEHSGDVGLSDEFSDNTHIMVALSGRIPTAYHVCLCRPWGSIRPKSYRPISEVYIENRGKDYCNMARLLDRGGGKFCLIDYSASSALLVCVFKVDFAREHGIQTSSINKGWPTSSEILSSKKFQYIPFINETWFTDACLGSAPSNEKLSATEHEVTAASSNEDQDRDGEIEKRNKISNCKRERGGNNSRGTEDMGVEEEYKQVEGYVGDKRAKSLSSLVCKGKAIQEPSTKPEENQEHDPVALARSLVSHFELDGLDKTGDKSLSRRFIRTQLKAIKYGLEMIDRADATSEQRIIQEAEYAAAEAKVKVLELQLEASNKANSAAHARLEALEQKKVKLRETVKAQKKQLKSNAEELASTQDIAIQEWRQSEEFKQAAQLYARENMDDVLSGFLSDKVAQKFFKALFKTEAGKCQLRQPKPLVPLPLTADEEDEGKAPGPSAAEEVYGQQEHEVTPRPNSEDHDRDGQMEKRNKTSSHNREMRGNKSKKRCCRSRE